jgi:RecB family endonuclease NucS
MSKKSIKGTVGEHKVIVQLLEDGYHVAKAVDQHCPFDLIAVDEDGNVKLIDVKTVSYRKKTKPNWKKSRQINRVPSVKQKKMKIELIMVD